MYIFSLDKYMLHHGVKTIDDLLENRHNPSKIEEQIIDWIVFLRTILFYFIIGRQFEKYLV